MLLRRIYAASSLSLALALTACQDPTPPASGMDLAGGVQDMTMSQGPDLTTSNPLDALINAYVDKYLGCLSLPDPVPPAAREFYEKSIRIALTRVTTAKGTGWSPPGMVACSKALQALTCAALIEGVGLPNECKFTGSQPNGGACADAAQCQSGACRGGGGLTCGSCITEATLGQSCSDVAPCTQSLYCITGKCVAGGAAGQACDGTKPCARSLSCVANVCTAQSNQGQRCGNTGPYCVFGLYCQTGTCVSLKKAGESCDPAIRQCSALHYCDSVSKTCKPATTAALGESCSNLALCKDGYCDPNNRCASYIADGQACDTRGGGCGPNSGCQNNKCVPYPSCP